MQVLSAVLVETSKLKLLQVAECAPALKKQLQILFVVFRCSGGYREVIAIIFEMAKI